MAVALERLSFADYLQYDNGTDVRYELVAGELIPMSLGTGLHAEIMHLLEKQFEAAIATRKLPWVARKGAIGIQSPQRGRWDTVRIPDVVVLPQQQWQEIRSREAVILLSEPPPLLVVEVASPSTASTDYRAKRTEYAVLDIAEYWIVDPLEGRVTVCTLVDGFYDTAEFRGSEAIQSGRFEDGLLSAEQILNP